MWSAVGVMLCGLAYRWLTEVPRDRVVLIMAVGLLLALIVYRLGFSRIVARNIERISHSPDRVCFFAFQPWKSYLIIVVMITVGSILRHSRVPRQMLSVLYTAIGGALFLASFLYYSRFWRTTISHREHRTKTEPR